MNRSPAWQYDEFRQVGKDYSQRREVEAYDPSHADFRDVDKEFDDILDLLALQPGQVLVDIGCGTGRLPLAAAGRGLVVHAADVSKAMLDFAADRAKRDGAEGIQFVHAGYLSLDLPPRSVDAVVSNFSLHHLPDLWKARALQRIERMLKPGGQLYLHDVILPAGEPAARIEAFVESQAAAGGEFLRQDAEQHFRREFTTYDWILEGMLDRAGLAVVSKRPHGHVLCAYHCRKP
jgi:ubiquinone/menaquinone biosynthesis C-methylase UbiE